MTLFDLRNVRRNLNSPETWPKMAGSSALERCVAVDSASPGRSELSWIVDSPTNLRTTRQPPRKASDMKKGI